MAGEHDRRATRRQLRQHAVHVTGADRVQAIRGFVEHQQPRPRQQRGRQPEPLPHAEREAAHAVVGDIGQADLIERIADPVGAVAPQAGQRVEVLARGERGIQARAVDEPRDPVRQRERPAHRAAEDLQLAAVGSGQPEQQPEQRRLARPVRADQAVHLAFRDVEVDAVQGHDLAEGLAEPAGAHGQRPAGGTAGRFSACPETGQPAVDLQGSGRAGRNPPVNRRLADRGYAAAGSAAACAPASLIDGTSDPTITAPVVNTAAATQKATV